MPGIKTASGKERRLVVLELLREFNRQRGYMPTLQEMVELTGIPRASLEHHLNSLRAQGFIGWIDGRRAMTLHVTSKRKNLLE